MNAKKTLLTAALAALAACSDAPVTGVQTPEGVAPVRIAAAGTAIEGTYIVVLRDGADARGLARAVGAQPGHVYERVLNGFAATLNAAQLRALQHNPHVEYIQQDQVAGITTTQAGAPWGLDRIDQRTMVFPGLGLYSYNATGAGVRAYVIDTGISTHIQFTGRMGGGYTAIADGLGTMDCNGHGTHVAGTIGGTTYGVAKQVYLVPVRVMGCDGTGAASSIIAGIDWVARSAVRPAVANLSLGGGYSQPLNDAVTRLANAGVFVAVAAGNENTDACTRSPASAPGVTTVAASDALDQKASYSNHGSCVDVYAPGTSITSSWLFNLVNTVSGTSMATPHVAGVAALYKSSQGDAAQATIDGWIKGNATINVIRGNPAGTPNRLLFKGGL